jgi:predicted thioesterase
VKESLQPGLEYEFGFKIPPTKTVPQLYPESGMFQEMPEVLATGFMVGLLEWACIEAIRPHLDWPREQSLGTHVDFSHLAATPPGFTVTVKCGWSKSKVASSRSLCQQMTALTRGEGRGEGKAGGLTAIL